MFVFVCVFVFVFVFVCQGKDKMFKHNVTAMEFKIKVRFVGEHHHPIAFNLDFLVARVSSRG